MNKQDKKKDLVHKLEAQNEALKKLIESVENKKQATKNKNLKTTIKNTK